MFTPDEIEKIRYDAGITVAGAREIADMVARMCAAKIRAALDPDDLLDGDSHARGMERAAALIDPDQSPAGGD